MKTRTVKDLMIPISEYQRMSKEASLFEAAHRLQQVKQQYEQSHEQHRGLVVVDENEKVIGKVSQLDLLRGLERKYRELGLGDRMSRAGFNLDFLRSMLETYHLWDKPLADLCRKAAETKVKEFMDIPVEGEYVQEQASLDEAVHQLIMGRHHTLLVTRDKQVVGIIRLSDVFDQVEEEIAACEIG